MSWMDRTSSVPLDGHLAGRVACRELTGKFFDEADISGYEPDVLDDFTAILKTSAPVCKTRRYSPAPGTFMGPWRIYERLLLPLATDGKTIDPHSRLLYPLADRQKLTLL